MTNKQIKWYQVRGTAYCALKFVKGILKPILHVNRKSIVPGTFLFIALVLLQPVAFAADSGIKILDEIPVQHAGRIKPFQSFASEATLYITGRHKYKNYSSSELLWQWMARADQWFNRPFIPLSYKPLKEEFDLMVVDNRISPEIVLSHEPFLAKVREAAQKREVKERLTELEKKRLETYERASFFQRIGQGQIPGWIPHPDDPHAQWLPLQAFQMAEGQDSLAAFYPVKEIEKVRDALLGVLQAAQSEDPEAIPAEKAQRFKESLEDLFVAGNAGFDDKTVKTEIMYNRLRPFHWAWILYLLSFITALGLAQDTKLTAARNMASVALFASGFAVHSFGFVQRCMISGRPPVTNMYESMIWVSWAVVLFAFMLHLTYKALSIRQTAALVAGFALILAEQFPVALNPAISPLVPVLRSNLWLTVHVLTITLSYGAFALAWGIGHVVLYRFAFQREDTEALRGVSQYLYRAVQIGVVLLAAGTVLGGVWANYSWGRFWGWDPKETWALIALLCYLVVLHGRFTGWLQHFGIALGSVLAFLSVVMAWYGVNFVLGAGLHSYGFGGGGIVYVLSAVAADLAVVGYFGWLYKKEKHKELEWKS